MKKKFNSDIAACVFAGLVVFGTMLFSVSSISWLLWGLKEAERVVFAWGCSFLLAAFALKWTDKNFFD